MFRTSLTAAWLALMYSDLPGVTTGKQYLARCMALQTVTFVLGENAAALGGEDFSFQVGYSCASLLLAW
jgi:hypothetical protein